MRKSIVIGSVLWALFVLVWWTILMEKALNIKEPLYPFKSWVDLSRYLFLPWVITLWVFACGYVVGEWTLGKRVPGNGLRDVFVLGIGLAIVAVLVFVQGLLGALYVPVFIVEGTVVVAFGWRQLYEVLGRLWRTVGGVRKWRAEELVMLGMIVWYICRTMALTCNPSLGWDTGNSHLAAPRWYLREHVIHFQSWLNFNNFPQLVEMLGMLVMSAVGDPGGTISYLYFLGISVLTYGLVRDRTAGLAAALVWISMPYATRYSQELYVEMALGFYCALAVYALLEWKRYDLAGLAMGAALSVKYTAAPFLILLMIAAGKQGWWKVFLWAVPLAALWYLRNIVLFGNPVFPFMDNLVRIPGLGTIQDPLRAELVIDHESMLANFRLDWKEIPGIVWWGTMVEREPWVRTSRPASIGPWLLGLLPVMIAGVSGRKRETVTISAVALVYLAYWVLLERIWDTRYLVAVWPMLCAVAGLGLREVMSWFSSQGGAGAVVRKDKKGWAAGAGWIAVSVLIILWMIWMGGYALWFAEGKELKLDPRARYEYLMTGGKPALPLVSAINDSIAKGDMPEDIVVYGLGMEHYRFFADFKLIGGLYGYANHADMMRAVRSGGAKGLWEYLVAHDVDYLAVDQWTVDFSAHEYQMYVPTEDPEWETYFSFIVEGNQNVLYQVLR